MDRLEGKISKIRFSTNVSGGEITSTEQIAVFELSGRAVEFKSKESIIIEEGDTCVVAGITENGLFKALAFNNKTKNIYSVNNAKGLKVFGAIFTAIGIITIPVLVGIVFTYVGLKIIKHSTRINKAHNMVLSNS